MGHYKEEPFNINFSFKTDQDHQFLFECIYNLDSGWNVSPIMLDERIQLIEVDYEAYYKTVDLKEEIPTIRNTGSKKEDTSMWHSIIPRDSCEHCDEFIQRSNGISEGFRRNSCKVCNDTTENWYCLTCGEVFCSRYVNSHGFEHFKSTGHAIFMSFTDLSSWCYLCDYYINDIAIRPALFLLHMTKFKTPHPSDDSLDFISRFYCDNCQEIISNFVFHCNDCKDYDLCQKCHDNESLSKDHTKDHQMTKKKIKK